MNSETCLVGQLLVAVPANVLLVGFEMAPHVLVVGALRHLNVAETTAEKLRLVFELMLAIVSFVFLVGFKLQSAILAVPDVESSEVIFRALPSLVHAGVLRDPGVGCVLLATGRAHVAMIVYEDNLLIIALVVALEPYWCEDPCEH